MVIKADIEGAELKIIPDMVRRNAFNKLRRAAQKDKFLVIVFNKESADVLTLRIFQVKCVDLEVGNGNSKEVRA